MALCRRHLSQSWPVVSFRTTFSGYLAKKQLKNSFFVTVKTETFVPQIAYPPGCSSNHLWRHRLQRVLYHGCSIWLQKMRPCQQGNTSIGHVSIVKLKLRHNGIYFRLLTVWRVWSSGLHTLFASKLTRKMRQSVDLPSQNLAQNRQYRDTVTCLPAHNEQRLVKVVKVQIICTRSGSIVILLPPTHQQGSRNNQRYRMNQRCTIMTKLVLRSEPHACAPIAVQHMMIAR